MQPPLSNVACGWPAGTAIEFEGYAYEDELGLQVSSPTHEQLYWLVTADDVDLTTSAGTASGRVACGINRDGELSWRVISDDWEPPATY